ncbi:MAG: Uma2 family endonuclease [Acidobacteria bacterium]|nr:Uma2 family endonuclease [Acidobacteriota bacterium]
MATATLVSVDEYLNSSYPDGDREYVEGRLVELGMPTCEHGFLQSDLARYLGQHYPLLWVGISIRIQVTETRYRVPDVVAGTGDRPGGKAIYAPPLLVVEITSPDDRIGELDEKIEEYLALGIPYVWEINPRTRKGYIHTPGHRREATDGILRASEPEIAVPLAELF